MFATKQRFSSCRPFDRLKVKIYYSINPWSTCSESNKQLRHFSVTFPHILEWMDHDFELFANKMRTFVDNIYFKGESYIYLKSRFISTVLMHKPCFFVPLLELNFQKIQLFNNSLFETTPEMKLEHLCVDNLLLRQKLKCSNAGLGSSCSQQQMIYRTKRMGTRKK